MIYIMNIINCGNVREYNALMHLTDGEVKLASDERSRDYKIENILN